jgi:pyruvate, water dikinase
MSSPAYVQFFDTALEPNHRLLGGKCSSLVSMTAAGMPVPPGFAITTASYDTFIRESGIAGEISALLTSLNPEDVAHVDEVSAKIREYIEAWPVPERVREEVHAAYLVLQSRFDEEIPVAVRSSATAEDLPDASFAGQQETYLWLTGFDAVRHHVRRCWASLYTSRAITYRLRNNIPDAGLSMAVAVQKMVNAKASGVAITMNPSTGDRSKIAIDASYGLGEMVVSGTVTPDNILLDKVMLSVVRLHIGDKHAELVPDSASAVLVEREVAAERRRVCCLGDGEILAVARLAKRAERHYGCPQDIEWALDADLPDGHNLLLLQSRPETVHSIKPVTGQCTSKPSGFSMAALTAALIGSSPPETGLR